jgi:hypothetical protein
LLSCGKNSWVLAPFQLDVAPRLLSLVLIDNTGRGARLDAYHHGWSCHV